MLTIAASTVAILIFLNMVAGVCVGYIIGTNSQSKTIDELSRTQQRLQEYKEDNKVLWDKVMHLQKQNQRHHLGVNTEVT